MITFYHGRSRDTFSILSIAMTMVLILFSLNVKAQNKGLNFQAMIKSPNGSYPTASNVSVTVQLMAPGTGCILREEIHTGVTINKGYLSLAIGNPMITASGGKNPPTPLSIVEVFDNATNRSNLV